MLERSEFDRFASQWLPLLEEEMRAILFNGSVVLASGSSDNRDLTDGKNQRSAVDPYYGMMHYHMGWVDEAFRPGRFATGKHIRPLLCLLACQAVGGDPYQALPAAAAVEILHNFSLVHDDIEDGDEVRRHRPTMWAIWGVPQAINAGDGMFALAYAALLRSTDQDVPSDRTLAALQRLTRTCLHLTEGQYLDISFEKRDLVSVDEYLQMIAGKTASLIAAALSIGALVGGGSAEAEAALHRFGYNIGLAFQIRDDILGIWGDPSVTGKAAGNDLLRQKKSLPILYGLHHPEVGPQLQRLWRYAIGGKQLPTALALLDQARARSFAQERLQQFHHQGLAALDEALGSRAASSPLMDLADELMVRQA